MTIVYEEVIGYSATGVMLTHDDPALDQELAKLYDYLVSAEIDIMTSCSCCEGTNMTLGNGMEITMVTWYKAANFIEFQLHDGSWQTLRYVRPEILA